MLNLHTYHALFLFIVSLEPPVIRQVAKLIQNVCAWYINIVDVFMHAPQLLLAITIVFQRLSKNHIHPS